MLLIPRAPPMTWSIVTCDGGKARDGGVLKESNLKNTCAAVDHSLYLYPIMKYKTKERVNVQDSRLEWARLCHAHLLPECRGGR